MAKPKKDAERSAMYLVVPSPTERGGPVGRYVGESDNHVVLNFSDSNGETTRAFPWEHVEPVELKATT